MGIFELPGAPALNPFARPEKKPGHERLMDYKEAVTDFERHCLYDAPETYNRAIKRGREIERRFPEMEHGPVEYYVGAVAHADANGPRFAFWHMEDRITKKTGLTIDKLSVDDVMSYYHAFELAPAIMGMEDAALAHYEKAAEGGWQTVRADARDARALAIDLADRIVATREEDPEKRAEGRAFQLKRLAQMINGMPHSGRQSELKLIYLLRKWSIDKDVGHLVTVEHGLPSEDMAAEKIDVRLMLGAVHVPLQVKTEVMSDAYRREHYESVRAKASAAIQGSQTSLLPLDTEDLDTAYEFAMGRGEKSAATRAKHKILDALAVVVPNEGQVFLQRMSERKKTVESEAGPASKRITKDYLARNANIPTLVKLGLLEQGDVDPPSVRRAKDLLIEHASDVARVFKTQEAFEGMSPQLLEIARTALGIEGRS
jgi:hypothetical protein